MRLVSSQSPEEIKKREAKEDLEFALREMAANVLRIVRGAGRAYGLPKQLTSCLVALQAYRDAHGVWPSNYQLQQAVEWDAGSDGLGADKTEAEWEQSEIRDAEQNICRAALQIVASEMMDQPLQRKRGQSDLIDAVTHLEKVRELRRKRFTAGRRSKRR